MPPVNDAIRALLDHFDAVGDVPLSLVVNVVHTSTPSAEIAVWVNTRTTWEALVGQMGLKAKEKAPNRKDERGWLAETEVHGVRVLMQAVSFAHHGDWKPRSAA